MISKVKAYLKELRDTNRELLLHSKEIEWAHVYHDSIRGIEWIENQPLNIGRWAGNYTFFYLLNRVLHDYKPNKILEFGLGESSKFTSLYLDNYLLTSKHLIIEHSEDWKTNFIRNFNLSSRSEIKICPLIIKNIEGYQSKSYSKLEDVTEEKFDLYIIDGPFGSNNYSRYDIVEFAEKFTKNDEFIILFDDYNRNGEKETVKYLMNLLDKLSIKYYTEIYKGNKDVLVIVTEKYKYVTSL